jgi:hypothetical protein
LDTFVKFLVIPAMSAYFYNDVLGLISLLGSVVLFLGTFPGSRFKRWIGLAEWNSAPLVFGTFFQVCFLAIGLAPETPRMGVLVPMSPGLVTGLFGLSFVLLIARRWVKRKESTSWRKVSTL